MLTGLGLIAGYALLNIGAVGFAGIFTGPNLGWVTVGLGGAGLACNLALGRLKERSFEVFASTVATATLVMFGIFGGLGMISASQVGLGIILTSAASLPFGFAMAKIKWDEMRKRPISHLHSS